MSTPITTPAESASGPPESPGWILAVVWSMLWSVSVKPEAPSAAWIVRPVPLITPGASTGGPPAPARLPMATTVEPTATVAESPIGAGEAPGSGVIRSTAMSAEVSAPTICA